METCSDKDRAGKQYQVGIRINRNGSGTDEEIPENSISPAAGRNPQPAAGTAR